MSDTMTPELWNEVERRKCFSRNEAWGDPLFIHPPLIFALEKLRVYAKRPIIIHCSYDPTPGHVSNSLHYKNPCKAVDLHISGMHVIEQFLCAIRFREFTGIGLYPDWNQPGLHLEVNEERPIQGLWWRDDTDGNREYKALTPESFSKMLSGVINAENKNNTGLSTP